METPPIDETRIRAILDGPDFFDGPFGAGARIRKSTCVGRQTKGILTRDRYHSIPFECRECPTGKNIKEAMTMNGDEFTAFQTNKEGMIPEEVILCKDCGENPAVIGKHGNPTHGRCGPCQGLRIREGKKKEMAAKTKKTKKSIPLSAKGDGILHVDLTDYPEVLESLQAAATMNIRPIEYQAKFYIVQGLKNDSSLHAK